MKDNIKTYAKDLSIIIVNYNTDKLVLQAVDSVYNYIDGESYEIIIVDNNSPKKTQLEELLSNKPNIYVYKLPKNIGFGRANNYGFTKSNGRLIFLMNSDVYFIDKSLSKLINFLDKNFEDNIACCCPNLITPSGNSNLTFGNFLSEKYIKYQLGHAHIKHEDLVNYKTSLVCNFKRPKHVDYVSGAAMLIRREVIEKLGLFNPKFFMYYEDMDLCYKFLKNGYKSFVVPDSKMIHIGGQSWFKSENNKLSSSMIILKSKYLFSLNIMTKLKAVFYYMIWVFRLFSNLIISKIKQNA